jgi:hypothetical protein
MIELAYSRASDATDAIRRAEDAHAKYLGGGTNLVDLMREAVEVPSALVDVTGLSEEIKETEDGGLMIGAAARNTAVAEHPAVRARYSMLTRAIVPAPQRRSATWRRSAAICCSEPAAPTSMTPTDRAATSGLQARAATRSRVSTACMRFSALRQRARPPTRRTCALHSPHWTLSST